jgi:tryptophan-rich sensory protein
MMTAKQNRVQLLAGAGLAAIAVAGLGALTTQLGPWYYSLSLPAWKPPDWLFGPAWTIIFGFAAASGFMALSRSPRHSASSARILALFAINGTLNILWSVLFFRLHRPDWALLEVILLWISIAALIAVISRLSKLASLLLLPYLLWVSFAAVLNYSVVQLNAPFSPV